VEFLSLRSGCVVLVLALTGCGAKRGSPLRALPTVAPVSCVAPLSLVFGTPMRASSRQGSDRLRASCVRGAAAECVFTVDVLARSELRVSLETNDFDGALALYDAAGNASAPRELRCVDDVPNGDTHHSRLEFALPPGRYLLAVDGANGETGDFELFAELEPLETIQHACAAASPLAPGVTLRDSTRGGENRFSASCAGGAQGPDHVHTISVEQPSRLRVRQQAEYDGSLYLRARCEDASSEIACNDDFQSNLRSQLTARVAAGTYYLFSDSYSREQSGDYALTFERFVEPPATSAEAVCGTLAANKPLPAGQHELDTMYGTATFAGSCGGQGASELAFMFHVEAPTTMAARLEDAEFNAVMYVRRLCQDERSELACFVAPRVDRPPSEQEMSSPALVMPLEKGTYALVVDGFEPTDIGAATLRLAFSP
jgi:hypothetical protein